MMNAGFTLTLLGLLAATLAWIAVVDVRTFTISNRLNLAIAMVALFHPDREVAWSACLAIGLFVAYWVLRRRAEPVRAASGAA